MIMSCMISVCYACPRRHYVMHVLKDSYYKKIWNFSNKLHVSHVDMHLYMVNALLTS